MAFLIGRSAVPRSDSPTLLLDSSVAFAAVTIPNLHRPTWMLSAGASVLGGPYLFHQALILNGYFRLSANVVYVFDSPAGSGVFGTAQFWLFCLA